MYYHECNDERAIDAVFDAVHDKQEPDLRHFSRTDARIVTGIRAIKHKLGLDRELSTHHGDVLMELLRQTPQDLPNQTSSETESDETHLPQVRGLPWNRCPMPLCDTVHSPALEPYDAHNSAHIRYLRGLATPPDTVILPVWQGQVVLVRHFRHANHRWHLAIPRSFGESGGDGFADARRKLTEELQATPIRIMSLGRLYTDAEFSDAPVGVFYAEIASFGAEKTEKAIDTTITMSPVELEHAIAAGEIDDGFTLAAYARAHAQGLL